MKGESMKKVFSIVFVISMLLVMALCSACSESSTEVPKGRWESICPHMIFDIYGEMTVVNKTERTEIRMPIDDGKIWNSNGTVTRLQISMYDGNFSIRIPDESKESFTEYDVLYRGTYHIYPLTVTLTKKEAIMRKVKLIVHETYQGKRKREGRIYYTSCTMKRVQR